MLFHQIFIATLLMVELRSCAAEDIPKDYCVGKTTGIHPHPGTCRQFIQCAHEILHVTSCPPGTLFDRAQSLCIHAVDVTCPFSDSSLTTSSHVTSALVSSSTVSSIVISPSSAVLSSPFVISSSSLASSSVVMSSSMISSSLSSSSHFVSSRPISSVLLSSFSPTRTAFAFPSTSVYLLPSSLALDSDGNVVRRVDYSTWALWGECNARCGMGTQMRCAYYGDIQMCDGSGIHETRSCEVEADCQEDIIRGTWLEWKAWNECSRTCYGGIQMRTRSCNLTTPVMQSNDMCDGADTETANCNMQICPVDGAWGEWLAWSTCSRRCGNGTQARQRKCDSPAPRYGGLPCDGKSAMERICLAGFCKVLTIDILVTFTNETFVANMADPSSPEFEQFRKKIAFNVKSIIGPNSFKNVQLHSLKNCSQGLCVNPKIT